MDYGEGLSVETLYDVYGKLTKLPDDTKNVLFKYGYSWERDNSKDYDTITSVYNSISQKKYSTGEISNKVDEVNSIFNSYAIDATALFSISLERVVCYNPKIAKNFMFGESTNEVRRDVPSLFIGLVDGNSKVYNVLNKCCPNIINYKSWSNPKSLSNDFKTFISKIFVDTIFAGKIVHLYMKGNTPVIDILFESKNSIHNEAVDKLVSKVIDTFGTNIKEIYISFNMDNNQNNGMLDMLLSGEVIARKNNDDELTLTIY